MGFIAKVRMLPIATDETKDRNREEARTSEIEILIMGIRARAENLYLTRQMLCAEAILSALNQGLGGGLTEDQAVAIAAPFCIGLGESGCLCGALGGAQAAVGLLLGKDHTYRRRGEIRAATRRLHDQFKAAHGSACCRALTRKVKHDKAAHFRQCAELTADGAEMAARLILERRPELACGTHRGQIWKRESRIRGGLLRLLRYIRG